MHIQQRGKNIAAFIFIFLLLGLITANLLFYAAGVIIAFAVFFDLVSFLAAIKAMEISIIRKINKSRLFVGNALSVDVELKINARHLKNIYLQDVYPDAFQLGTGDSAKRIDTKEPDHSISYTLSAAKRGIYHFSESFLHLESNFHMFMHSISLESRSEVSVYPPVLSRRSIQAGYISSLYGPGRSKQRGMGIEVANIRDYIAGDDFRHIDWKTSLRLNSMFTREFESDTGLPVFVLMDHSSTDDSSAGLDHAVIVANYLTQQAANSDQQVGLITFTHDRVTNQALLKKGKKRLEIIKDLFTLAPVESRPYSIAMDTGEIKEIERKLGSYNGGGFYSVLAPFFTDRSEHLKAMEMQGIYQAIKRVISFSRTPSMIAIITDLVSDVPFIESIRLATYYGNRVVLIVTPRIFFREYDVVKLEEHFQEYMVLQRKIERFRRLKNVRVIEVGPGDKPEVLINQAVYRWKMRY
ncbi:hypothetical protein ANME2D_01242 [Candidatus Methanoperedens nitroreducens]|uniref:DUF58 domain-containing protein n=1 Tax=Candidatus Methanoperedens nitratireducens TaxID=1392998 RepID=A0A062V666_9EURY|nr:DUF58 domain-containing protein [Candidatus Methanoperedens nitroreducens]KCZ72807.1 hypothetical protein ANME2D_01242 [Candidatus Methanoperedens nitroreducens]MDJ1423263.1 DUF58 domain-containing protein [Candidatus Methanoperedens sp.]